MLEFLSANAGTIFVAAVLVLILVCIVIKMRKDKKKGGCCGGCAGCPSQGACHINKEQTDNKN